ncbi:MAG: hypothetical protein ABI995_02190 [Acidobacteriota bacterium]
MNIKTIALAAFLSATPGLVYGQFDFSLAHRNVQVHSFASQGFAYSNANNYLTMKTSQGSFAMTDGGGNISTQITDKLRIGAQIYIRNVGELGRWHPVLDWGFADYRFKDWFGVRGGKVKTTLGLFNDSQDSEFVHTWALLPQSIYPLDLRGATIAHNGGDAYGVIPIKTLGHLEYTVYGGMRAFDPHGGYPYSLHTIFSTSSSTFNLQSETGSVVGADLRWNTPLKGLLVGASRAVYGYQNHGEGSPGNARQGYSSARATGDSTNAFYFDYSLNRLRFYGEYQRYLEAYDIFVGSAQQPFYAFGYATDRRMAYVAGSYRVAKHLEIGSYYSYYIGEHHLPHSDPRNHLFDKTVTARIDLNSNWNVKVEGHFMDGAPDALCLHGFYTSVNPNGVTPAMNMVVIRTGFAF